MIGDVIILPTTPPHVATVVGDGQAMCEDGIIRPYTSSASLVCPVVEVLKEMERSVLAHDTAG